MPVAYKDSVSIGLIQYIDMYLFYKVTGQRIKYDTFYICYSVVSNIIDPNENSNKYIWKK